MLTEHGWSWRRVVRGELQLRLAEMRDHPDPDHRLDPADRREMR